MLYPKLHFCDSEIYFLLLIINVGTAIILKNSAYFFW